MIIVCKNCISGCEELNSNVSQLPKDTHLECFHCPRVIDSNTTNPAEPIYVIEELVLPPEFVSFLEINSCQNCGCSSGTELCEYVRDVLESQDFEKHYPTLSMLFDEDHERFEIPEINCRRCDSPDTSYWLNYVGDSRLPIARFSPKRRPRRLSVLEDAWFDGGEPREIISLDPKTDKFIPSIEFPPNLCGIYSELEVKPNTLLLENDGEFDSFYLQKPEQIMLFLETCKSVCGRFINSDEEVLNYKLTTGFVGVFLWVEKDKIIRKNDSEKIAFFQEFINHYLSCREHVYPSEIGIPKFCLDGRIVLFRENYLRPWSVFQYDPPKIDFAQIFEASEIPRDLLGGLVEKESSISISWQLLVDAIAQFRQGRYRECILNCCSSIETQATPNVEKWLKEQTFSGSKTSRTSYKITQHSIEKLKADGLSSELSNKLESLRDKNYATEQEFLEGVKQAFGVDEFSLIKSFILEYSDLENKEFRGDINKTIMEMSNPVLFETYFNLIAKTRLSKLYKPEEQKSILKSLKEMNNKRNKIVHEGLPASSDEALNAIYAVGKVMRAVFHSDN